MKRTANDAKRLRGFAISPFFTAGTSPHGVFFVVFPFFVHFVFFVAKLFVSFVAATWVAATPRWVLHGFARAPAR